MNWEVRLASSTKQYQATAGTHPVLEFQHLTWMFSVLETVNRSEYNTSSSLTIASLEPLLRACRNLSNDVRCATRDHVVVCKYIRPLLSFSISTVQQLMRLQTPSSIDCARSALKVVHDCAYSVHCYTSQTNGTRHGRIHADSAVRQATAFRRC